MIRLATSLVITCLLAAAPVRAEDDDCTVAMADWQPRAAVEEFAAAQGWTLARIRLDDGCYEVLGTDATGRRIEAKLDPAQLTIIELEYEDHGTGGGSHDGDDD